MIVFIVDCQNGNGHLARSIALASKLKSLDNITLNGNNINKKYIYKINFIKFINTDKNVEMNLERSQIDLFGVFF